MTGKAGKSGKGRWLAAGLAALTLSLGCVGSARADVSLLNVSYDVTRELYKDINTSFVAAYRQKTGETVSSRMAHRAHRRSR